MLRTPPRTRPIAALAATLLVVAIAGCGGSSGSASTSPPAAAETTTPKQTRTVTVYAHEPAPSPSPIHLNAGLEAGTLPDKPVLGTVLTDEDCEPDARGISHCRNVVRLPDGSKVVLRHPHAMMEVECMEPGEKVLLRRA
ncbi:MAG TPA: hypothetical protein VFP23_01225 [Solirubrobacterales bacterium]|nr:hypothetical protein [Solirubrobacterales bacterium]